MPIKNRAELTGYFVKNAVPTADNFKDLIESTLNQQDDGIAKPDKEPLRLRAEGDAKTALKLYKSFGEPKPAWMLNVDPGFSVANADGVSRLFVDQGGNVGIGATQPEARLTVHGTAVISNGNGYATRNNYMAAGSLTIGSTDANYGGGAKWNANTAGLLLEAKDNTEIAVHDAGTRLASLLYFEGDAANRITIGRDMGWGRIKQVRVMGLLTPSAGKTDDDGIMFPRDPGGGSGDAAWLRYYPRSGEACTFEIGINNDGDDHIALMSSGGVGIGTLEPKVKLEVAGPVMEKLDVIACGQRGDWTAQNHPIMQYFKGKLSGKPAGTYLRALQDHSGWRGHYWEGWVDAAGQIRVIHNWNNTGTVVT
jgi:hypothetical protein